MSAKYNKTKDIIKAVKTELHIINESFLQKDCFINTKKILMENPSNVIYKVLELHSSTKERLKDIKEIYAFLSLFITEETSVMDIGCGFNPFAVSLLHKSPKEYYGYDINIELIELINRYFEMNNLPSYKAEVLDIITETPRQKTDIVLLFKLFPLLQQQKKNRTWTLLDELEFKTAIISFPLKSLSGKNKGMESFYSSMFEDNLPNKYAIIDKKAFSNEIFYVIRDVA
jgi:16S rRNA (guanine(1405)-N(7))-methyltransferase